MSSTVVYFINGHISLIMKVKFFLLPSSEDPLSTLKGDLEMELMKKTCSWDPQASENQRPSTVIRLDLKLILKKMFPGPLSCPGLRSQQPLNKNIVVGNGRWSMFQKDLNIEKQKHEHIKVGLWTKNKKKILKLQY